VWAYPTPSTDLVSHQTLGSLEQAKAAQSQAGTQQERQELIRSSEIPCHFDALRKNGTSALHHFKQTCTDSSFLKNTLPSKL